MMGRRIYPNENGELIFSPGDYGFDLKSGRWLARCPDPGCHTGDLSLHEVVEHEDKTITVSPSILTNPLGEYHDPSSKTWHGFLERGIWRTA